MSNERKIQISALNIVTHPHSPETYVDLFRRLYRLRQSIAVRRAQQLMIGELRYLNRSHHTAGVFGRIYRFDQIDPDAQWFNVVSNVAATSEELSEIKIPPSLKPNLVMFNFVFHPVGHWLYFETVADRASLGPTTVKRFFEALFSAPEIIEQFGKVDATIVPEHEQLDRILTLPGLSKLTIDVKRPNPDDLANEDQKVFARFDAMGARRLYQQYTAERGESIKPDDEVRLMARVASHNGSVQGVGMSAAGDRLLESTVDHPWRDTIRYDPDVELREDVMIARTQGAHGAGN